MKVQPTTILKVRQAIGELKANGRKASTSSVAAHLGLSGPRVYQVLHKRGELSSLDSFTSKRDFERIAQELKTHHTKNLILQEIKCLPIDGLSRLSNVQLSTMLTNYKIPHSRNLLGRVRLIENTELYTPSELFGMVEANIKFDSFKQLLYANKIPFKKVRKTYARRVNKTQATLNHLRSIDTRKMSIKDIWRLDVMKNYQSYETVRQLLRSNNIPYGRKLAFADEVKNKLNDLDTASMTFKEIHELVGGPEARLRIVIQSNKIPYRKLKRKEIKFKSKYSRLYSKLDNIDTSQYTVEELRHMLGFSVPVSSLYARLKSRGQAYKKNMSIAEKLSSLDTSKHTIKELGEIVGIHCYQTMYYAVRTAGFPYKRSTKYRDRKNAIFEGSIKF
ncbi:hypothetical protein F7R25_04050 [Burkholderia stagnalis]|uniref:Uncharacterized protein n=1 Tax=Burkholderia stagnalis TaxID=1503054 RepID=A0A6L3N641_9BURK|nr:hypothetical protein [Burkholderia stagnalis]KAB0640677.1 hypothetical protein F7R25_04050 [Burkholderia stagnalis]VWB06427.1 hypothetical protein BST28156_00120 [Burkholderia stagnalis]